jgi:predicted transcriptional regulator
MLSGEKPDGFLYQLLRGEPRLPTIAELSEIIQKEEIGLVVVDSLYRTNWLSEENSNDSTGKELTPIQRLASDTGASVLVIDHTAKGGGDGRSAVDASRGASAKGGFFDGIFVLRPTDQGPDPQGNYVILDPVVRDWAPFKELPLMSFSWSATSADLEIAGEVDPNAANNDTTVILSILAECDNPVGNSFIAAQTNLSAKRTREALAKLTAKGKVIESPDPSHKQRKLYRLPDMGDKP